jgi:K+-transporting ATPase c subunit
MVILGMVYGIVLTTLKKKTFRFTSSGFSIEKRKDHVGKTRICLMVLTIFKKY